MGKIHDAAKSGDLETLKAAAENNPTLLTEGDEHGSTPLIWAIRGGRREVVKYLLSQLKPSDLDANAQGNEGFKGYTALHWASQFSTTADIALALIDRGADINKTDVRGRTPLMTAAYVGNDEVVNYLVAQENINLKATIPFSNDLFDLNFVGFNALHWAIAGNQTALAKDLIKKGFNVNSENYYGLTPLMMAVKGKNIELVEFLLAREDVDLNVVTKNYTERDSKSSFLKFNNFSALDLALMIADKTHDNVIVAKLIARGADITGQYKDSLVKNHDLLPIHIAVGSGNLDMVQQLLKVKGSERILNARHDGYTPLMLAIKFGHKEIVDQLLKQPDIDLQAICDNKDFRDKTALEMAREKGDKDTADKIAAVVYPEIYAQQEKQRRWKTGLAITLGIILGVLTAGLLAIPVYFIWRASKRNEPLQKMEMTSEEYGLISEKRGAVKKSWQSEKSETKPTTKPTKYKKAFFPSDDEKKKKSFFILDKGAAERLRFFRKYTRRKNPFITDNEKKELRESLTTSEKVKIRK